MLLLTSPSNLAQHKVGRGGTVFSDISEMNNSAEAASAEDVTNIAVGNDLRTMRFQGTGATGEKTVEEVCGAY